MRPNTEVSYRGGTSRISDDVAVMAMEQRGSAIQLYLEVNCLTGGAFEFSKVV